MLKKVVFVRDNEELHEKVTAIQKGWTYKQVEQHFGAKAYQKTEEKNKTKYYWRIEVETASAEYEKIKIYLGEFENDRLVFGALLPNG